MGNVTCAGVRPLMRMGGTRFAPQRLRAAPFGLRCLPCEIGCDTEARRHVTLLPRFHQLD
jgi:hypothetical protein